MCCLEIVSQMIANESCCILPSNCVMKFSYNCGKIQNISNSGIYYEQLYLDKVLAFTTRLAKTLEFDGELVPQPNQKYSRQISY